MRDERDEFQTPGAGPSRQRSRPPDILVPPPQAYLGHPNDATIRARTPTRTATIHEDVELGIYLRPDSAGLTTVPSSPSSAGLFPRRGSAGSVVVSKVSVPTESFFLANSIWRTDILTFCSHARADPVLGEARITQIQARKSRRPPFLHEYLLVFFTAARDQRFVMRIDRLGKVGSDISSGSTKTQGVAANTAIQEVGIYHVQDSQEPWLAMDGRWGSRPVATLATWEGLSASGEQVSHHVQTVALSSAPCPRLRDISRLLESILLEMPTYHLTTANCYLMTRSSLLLLQRCYSSSFACYLGPISNNPIPATILAEPVWSGLLRWYLPFVVLFFLAYIPLLLFFYHLIGPFMDSACGGFDSYDPNSMCFSFLARVDRATTYIIHAIFDVPLPVGIMHAYMTSLELQMNRVVVNLSAQFFQTPDPGNGEQQEEARPTPPFGVMFDDAWMTLVAWCALGLGAGVFVFLSMAFQYGLLVTFIIVLVLSIGFNCKFGDSGAGVSADQDELDELFGPTIWDTVPQPQDDPAKKDPIQV